MLTATSHKQVSKYLGTRERARRLHQLEEIKKEKTFLPISLAEDLLCLDCSIGEKLAIIEVTGSSNNLLLEDFLTKNLTIWPQDLASASLRLWAEKTERTLWYRLLPLASSPHLSQRVRYTILDVAWSGGGEKILKRFADAEGIEDFSSAFHALLIQRCLQWNIHTDRIFALAETIAKALKAPFPENKALPSALAYLVRYAPADAQKALFSSQYGEILCDFLKIVVTNKEQYSRYEEALKSFIETTPKDNIQSTWKKLQDLWPPVWLRHQLHEKIIAFALDTAAAEAADGPSEDLERKGWTVFAGCTVENIEKALRAVKGEKEFLGAIKLLGGLIPAPLPESIFSDLKERFKKTETPADFLAGLTLRTRIGLSLEAAKKSASADDDSLFSRLLAEEQEYLSLDLGKNGENRLAAWFKNEKFEVDEGYEPESALQQAIKARKIFFDLTYRGTQSDPNFVKSFVNAEGLWPLLAKNWTSPSEEALSLLAAVSRKAPAFFKICYINTLERFTGIDAAALKILDFVRTNEEDELRAVIKALGGIGTSRALQELIACLTRPNFSIPLKLEICNILKLKNVQNLQRELRAAIDDLNSVQEDREDLLELKEALSELLFVPDVAIQQDHDQTVQGASQGGSTSDVVDGNGTGKKEQVDLSGRKNLDETLNGKIPNYKNLSSEVRRALRTAQFFDEQVNLNATSVETIDLAPVIDMQYKALELIFRETFEESCTRVIHRGTIQRKLDIIGYARPIPAAMDEFENYIKNLPIVCTIPFFSKFKLRKMLRSICQFQPGKRFTLDGIKAFALFFLCFGRKQCRYGLQNMFPLCFKSDDMLADYCKSLHIFQDFRNRAAHEGFHPDASNNLQSIWCSTAEIIQNTYRLKEAMEKGSEADFSTPENRSNPVVLHRVS